MTSASIVVDLNEGFRVLLVIHEEGTSLTPAMQPEIKIIFSRWQIPTGKVGKEYVSGTVTLSKQGVVLSSKLSARGMYKWERTADLIGSMSNGQVAPSWMNSIYRAVEELIIDLVAKVSTEENFAELEEELKFNILLRGSKVAADEVEKSTKTQTLKKKAVVPLGVQTSETSLSARITPEHDGLTIMMANSYASVRMDISDDATLKNLRDMIDYLLILKGE